MQNKGFVKVFAVLLTLVCVFYLSFSFVTRHYNNKAKEIANGDMKVEQDYLDSLSNEKVWLGATTAQLMFRRHLKRSTELRALKSALRTKKRCLRSKMMSITPL